MSDHTPDFTPVEKVDGVYVKRDDVYRVAGVCGGKVRACLAVARAGGTCHGLITATARSSPQAQIVARLAAFLGVPARCHMPQGTMTEEMRDIVAHGGELVQHRAGYTNVIAARGAADAKARPLWRYVPFGMEHPVARACTANQVKNIPKDVKRIVVCLGGGMSAAGILTGLRQTGRDVPVVGVRIGGDPTKRLNTWAPFGWPGMLEIIDVTDKVPYTTAVNATLGGVALDPHYEAKCLPYLRKGDLFWVVGRRVAAATKETQ